VSRKVIPNRAYPYSTLSAAMNPANSEAAAAEKARRKDKKQKRKKRKDAIEDGAATAEEGTPHEKKQKQRKDGGEWEEKPERLKPTVSIAVAGSIIDNAQSLELATMVRTPT